MKPHRLVVLSVLSKLPTDIMDKLNFGGIRNQNKPKNSVASELISALTKPKVKDIKQERIDEFSRVFGKELNNVKTMKEDINPVK